MKTFWYWPTQVHRENIHKNAARERERERERAVTHTADFYQLMLSANNNNNNNNTRLNGQFPAQPE